MLEPVGAFGLENEPDEQLCLCKLALRSKHLVDATSVFQELVLNFDFTMRLGKPIISEELATKLLAAIGF